MPRKSQFGVNMTALARQHGMPLSTFRDQVKSGKISLFPAAADEQTDSATTDARIDGSDNPRRKPRLSTDRRTGANPIDESADRRSDNPIDGSVNKSADQSVDPGSPNENNCEPDPLIPPIDSPSIDPSKPVDPPVNPYPSIREANAVTLTRTSKLGRLITPSIAPADATAISDRPALHFVLTLIVLATVAAVNVWPRASQMVNGTADRAGWGIVAFQLLMLFILAQIPFAMGRITNGWIRFLLSALAGVLIAANLSFSIDSIGFVRDGAREHNRQIADKITTWTRERDDARAERNKLPTFNPTTDAQVTSAQKAVDDSRKAKDAECNQLIGFACRTRQDKLAEKEKELARLQADKAIQDRATQLEARISKLDEKLTTAGPAPTVMDPTAARIAGMTFGQATPDQVAENWPIFLGFVAELIAFGGPFALTLALTPRART